MRAAEPLGAALAATRVREPCSSSGGTDRRKPAEGKQRGRSRRRNHYLAALPHARPGRDLRCTRNTGARGPSRPVRRGARARPYGPVSRRSGQRRAARQAADAAKRAKSDSLAGCHVRMCHVMHQGKAARLHPAAAVFVLGSCYDSFAPSC
jgi:hypothetical protein